MAKIKISKSKLDSLANKITLKAGSSGKKTLDELEELSKNLNSNTLKLLLDNKKNTNHLFAQRTETNLDSYISYDDTSNVIDFTDMFWLCENLIYLPSLDYSNGRRFDNICLNCNSLKKVKINSKPSSSSSMYDNWSYAFKECHYLEEIDIHYFNVNSGNDVFYNCYSLKKLIIREFGNYKTLDSDGFKNNYHLTGAVNAKYNPNGLKDGYIYVPSAMVDTLKATDVWSTYATQIRALEDYTVDGTTTGELDESKI